MAKTTRMDASTLARICVERKMFKTPHLNDSLYLNAKGFTNIDGLQPYAPNLKTLILDDNSIRVIDGLDGLTELRVLSLARNAIEVISGLSSLAKLCRLNLSGNRITTLQGLPCTRRLVQLDMSHNRLSDAPEAWSAIASCENLEVLDATANAIECADSLIAILGGMHRLRVLGMMQNPISCMSRNTILSKLTGLTHLNDKPVTEDDRRCIAAWSNGGAKAEAQERLRIQDERDAELRGALGHLRRLQEKNKPNFGPKSDQLSQSEVDAHIERILSDFNQGANGTLSH